VSGGIAERAKFHPQSAATFLLVGLVYPFFEGIAWNNHYGVQDWLSHSFGQPFHDFAGSVVVHAVGGWIGLAAVLNLGASWPLQQGRPYLGPPAVIHPLSGTGRMDSDCRLVRL
jgi:ammonia channel protein AmtB